MNTVKRYLFSYDFNYTDPSPDLRENNMIFLFLIIDLVSTKTILREIKWN